MLRFAADENFNGDIVRGLLRRNPKLDIVRVQDVGLSGADDPSVLQWAADQGRLIVTHDISTLAKHAFDRIAAGQPMPGVFEVRSVAPVGQAIVPMIVISRNRDDMSVFPGQPHELQWSKKAQADFLANESVRDRELALTSIIRKVAGNGNMDRFVIDESSDCSYVLQGAGKSEAQRYVVASAMNTPHDLRAEVEVRQMGNNDLVDQSCALEKRVVEGPTLAQVLALGVAYEPDASVPKMVSGPVSVPTSASGIARTPMAESCRRRCTSASTERESHAGSLRARGIRLSPR